MNTFNIIGIGEILWDMLPGGKELGGAPANFAYHAQNLGGNSMIISSVGNDDFGHEIRELLKLRNLKAILSESELPTGTVSVEVENGIPSYNIMKDVAWDSIQLTDMAMDALRNAHAVCFGSLSQRSAISKNSIQKALATAPTSALKVFDINLRQDFYSKGLIHEALKHANILKINSEELMVISKYFNLVQNSIEACQQLIEKYNLQLLALTNGGTNSILISLDEVSIIPTPKVDVVDTVGAGDSFTAALVVGLLNKEHLKNIHRRAVDYSAKVCMFKGATPSIECRT